MTIDSHEDVGMKKSTAVAKPGDHSRITVAQFISKHLDIQASLGRTQKIIANELGYAMPNMVSMFRREEVKVPIPKVPALARALGVDPALLFRLVMMQHWPEEHQAMSEIFGSIVTKNEAALIDIWRKATSDEDPAPPHGIVKALKSVL
jgi:hypothetical protein